MKITLPPEALAALNAESDEPIKAPPKPLPMAVQRLIHEQVAKAVHGPSMRPTFKQQLLHFPSYAAMKAVWAADHFQRMAAERKK